MKINVVTDQSGKTIGTFEAASASGPAISPLLEGGAKVAQLDVNDNYKDNLKELYN